MTDVTIRIQNLSKCYHIYDAPSDRLKQFILPRIQRFSGRETKQYFREFWALKDVSFEIKKGETVGIIGRNGSGKSTLLQMICGTLNPTSGSIQTNGRIAALLELGSGFNPEFTGRENVYMNAAVLGLSKDEIDSRFNEIVAFADIGNFIEQSVKTYSSGMVVRLAFAVSVCVDPDILVIDEALAVGDAAFQFKCLDRMKRLTESGTTLLFVSHDMGMVKSFCHKVIYLEHGLEKISGSPDSVAEQYFFDIRDEQRSHVPSGMKVFLKKSLSDNGFTAFGTQQGQIVSAYFLPDQSLKAVVGIEGNVCIHIDIEHDAELSGAALGVIVADRRLLDIGGKYFFLKSDSNQKGKVTTAIEVEFKAKLRPGTYFITLRLEQRGLGRNFFPIDKQPAALSFEVMPSEPEFLGIVDIGMKQATRSDLSVADVSSRKKRVVALLAIRNEALYLPRCLEHLYQQGIETCVIDNDSTDGSLEVVKQFMNKGVFRIVRQPYKGCFDLVEQLRIKERLSSEIEADWFIHYDADEIREAPPQFSALFEALLAVDEAGYNAVNFDEFVFLPTNEDSDEEPEDYVRHYRNYYYFSPSPLQRVNAWKKQKFPVDLVTSGGHHVIFPEQKIYPEAFVLRHYVALSKRHLLKKYGQERIYNPQEVTERQWHLARLQFNPDNAVLPSREIMRNLDFDGLDRSCPFKTHPFLKEQ
jgi:lipopolysaccharide transport system ATP-binding protein